ncbi:MAG: hypothetical protein U0791_27930 [Gemmataceae bacterium]
MSRKKPTQPAAPSRRRRSLLVAAVVLLAVAGAVFALDLLGGEALRRVGLHGRYRARFADVQCESPRGMDRAAFLTEVRYLSEFPESFHPLDDAERVRLAGAFSRHPWVEHVGGVTVEPGNIVRVSLTFREPALVVRVLGGEVRLADANGLLLPECEAPQGTAELLNTVPPPSVNAGEPWPDDTVRQAIGLLKSYPLAKLERTDTGWRLFLKDGSVRVTAK